MTITIYHHAECGTSCNTLAMIRQSGEEPEVIEKLKTPPSREKIVEVITSMKTTPRELLRRYDPLKHHRTGRSTQRTEIPARATTAQQMVNSRGRQTGIALPS
ncbi:hypothetical protein MES4922_360056 [Mesorhizobium ventifaucium]|uniref:Arsenate reductase n=1 Tax=Mesorhizobium ventifaucium TaxID=666020 RepID=A0ABM9E5J3_9HYPH|nr:hypothetical protein MES4922_360056 [Mesorhizobium ventifaucium]